MRNHEEHNMKNKTGHEQISWFSKTRKKYYCMFPLQMLVGISKQSLWALGKGTVVARSQHDFTKKKTWQTNLIPVRIRQTSSRSCAFMISNYASLTGQEMAQKGKVMCSVSKQQGDIPMCILDWKIKISKLGQTAWKFPPTHATLQTAKLDWHCSQQKEKSWLGGWGGWQKITDGKVSTS